MCCNLFKKTTVLFCLLIVALAFAGCAAPPATDATPVRIATLPIVEALPLYAAREGGFFEKLGVKVEFVAAAAAAERDQLVAAGQVDGLINDLLAVALFNRQEPQLQVVRFAHVSTAGSPLYVIVVAPQSGIKTTKDLAGVEIGISQGSIIDYATNRMLAAAGLKPEQIKTVAVPKLPDRTSLLLSGQLKAATLPQPFATIAIRQGAVAILDDLSVSGLGNSVLSFRKSFSDAHPQAVKNLLAALDQAATDINTNPEKYRALLTKYNIVSDTLAATYPMPRFPGNTLPSQKQFEDVVAFALERKLLDTPVKFSDSVNNTFLK